MYWQATAKYRLGDSKTTFVTVNLLSTHQKTGGKTNSKTTFVTVNLNQNMKLMLK